MHTAAGFDAVLNADTVVGVSAVYTRDQVDLDGRTRASRIRTPHVVAYASHATESFDLRGVVGCGRHTYDTTRAVSLGGTTALANAQHNASECSAYAQAEFARDANSSRVRPLVGLLYSRLSEERYVETGSAAALSVAGHTVESLTSNAGLRYARITADERGMFEARAVWSHELGEVNPALRASLASATRPGEFTVRGTPRARDSLLLGAGFAKELGRGFLLHSDYNMQVDADREVRHTFVAGLRYEY
jgi:outer membrane autotransporter protein